MRVFVTSNILPNATKVVAFLCGTLGGTDSNARLKGFFELCKDKILTELESGASSSESGGSLMGSNHPFGFAKMSDAPFHYYQAILNACVLPCGESLLAYQDDLVHILDKTFEQSSSRRGYKWSSKLLKHTVVSLVSLYPQEMSSHSLKTFTDPGKTVWKTIFIFFIFITDRILQQGFQKLGRQWKFKNFRHAVAYSYRKRSRACCVFNSKIF
jgi:hypothetical protein